MAFVNVQLAIDELPAAEEIEMEPMAPEYQREVRAQQFIIFVPIVLVSFLPFLIVQQSFLLAIPVVVLLFGLFLGSLTIRMSKVKGVALRDKDIAYRSGLYWRKTVILAFNRVQHVEVSSGPLQRRYGLATLNFFTAGGSSVDLKVDGLTRQRAEQIRTFVLGKSEIADSE
ncbi:MAG: membrane protein YdbS with pleckstrin-like domain [Lysobacterales bacterium]|jgi:membrane protein YdbS with pleckstrin-like domain